MIITFQYRIKPTPEQVATMETWSESLRRHWNFALSQRLDWLNRTRCFLDRCSIVSEPIGEVPERVDYYTQQSALKETKKLFPEYAKIYSEVQQMNLQRLDKAWKRWLVPSQTGKRGGRPKFKKRVEKPSFSFSRVNHPKAVCFLEGNILRIPKIGLIPVIVHRPIPEGFVLKTATICFKADGYYLSISAEDSTVPEPKPLDEVKSAVGIDLGLKEFLATSTGEFVPVPQIYRKAQKHLARQQRALSRKKDGSKNRTKACIRVAKIHQRIARGREMFHYQVAHWLGRNYDLIAAEDLNIQGLARTRLAKSIYDVSWGKFITILESVVVKYGVHLVKVNPHNTSQNCSGCGTKVPKTLSVRLHQCPKCNLEMDRDENAAINILFLALKAVGLTVSACGALDNSRAMKQELLGAISEAHVTALRLT
jgi:transposase, IS605 OrfB family, central region